MLKLSRIRPCQNDKSCSTLHLKSKKKLNLHFSEFSTILYAFYKFLQKEYTIEVSTLRTDPWKFEILTEVPSVLRLGPQEDLGPSNVAPGRWPARFGLNSGEGSPEFG
jgi:hypothetical protein